jgi:RNA polymerase sigma-70 factor (ECF subfamily)
MNADDATDLVDQAIAGRPLALDRLLLGHYAKLAARVDQKLPTDLRTLIAADDIIQETFTDAFRRIGSFRPEGPDAFYRWLVAIADNRITDAVRSFRAAKRGGGRAAANGHVDGRTSIAALVDLVAVSDRTPSRSAGGHEVAAAIHVALAGMKPEYREPLMLRYLQGLSVSETALRMGKTEASVHKLCSRGLQALRGSMGEASGYLSRG